MTCKNTKMLMTSLLVSLSSATNQNGFLQDSATELTGGLIGGFFDEYVDENMSFAKALMYSTAAVSLFISFVIMMKWQYESERRALKQRGDTFEFDPNPPTISESNNKDDFGKIPTTRKVYNNDVDEESPQKSQEESKD